MSKLETRLAALESRFASLENGVSTDLRLIAAAASSDGQPLLVKGDTAGEAPNAPCWRCQSAHVLSVDLNEAKPDAPRCRG